MIRSLFWRIMDYFNPGEPRYRAALETISAARFSQQRCQVCTAVTRVARDALSGRR